MARAAGSAGLDKVLNQIESEEQQAVVAAESEGPVSLYRKYRPRRFDQLLGQGAVCNHLEAVVNSGHPNHAYMFSGSRGCGKTTTARLFAAALNCEDRDGAEPCGVCLSCITTLSGDSMGSVVELNAANNRGIDDMRDLISTLSLAVSTKYKVVIIDEVHQLTNAGGSVLLKYLEEPPSSQVIFILATTDPDKVLPTILSRVTHLRFQLLKNDQLEVLVRSVAEQEGMDLSDEQVHSAVFSGRGSARDTLSALDVVQYGGIPETRQTLLDVTWALAKRDVAGLLIGLSRAEASGGLEPLSVAEDVLAMLRDALVRQQAPELLPDAALAELAEPVDLMIAEYTPMQLIRCIEVMADSTSNIRLSGNGRAALEAGLIKALLPQARSTLEQLRSEIDRLEGLIDRVQAQLDTPPLYRPLHAEPVSQSGPDPWAQVVEQDAAALEQASEPEAETEPSEPEVVDPYVAAQESAWPDEPPITETASKGKEKGKDRDPWAGEPESAFPDQQPVVKPVVAPEAPAMPKSTKTPIAPHIITDEEFGVFIQRFNGRPQANLRRGWRLLVGVDGEYQLRTLRPLDSATKETITGFLGNCIFETDKEQ